MTKIPWTDQTWNPIVGCSKISDGCKNCYAETMAARLSVMLGRIGTGGQTDAWSAYSSVVTDRRWNGSTALIASALSKPFLRKKPARFFVGSMGDLFHPSVPSVWIDQVMAVVSLCSRHIFQLLTKRPERMCEYFERYYAGTPPLPNIWLGVTAENQAMADERIPALLQIPASKRYISVEPILGPIEVPDDVLRNLDWVIIGAESGPNRRQCSLEWVSRLGILCNCAAVPWFVKQIHDINGKLVKSPANWPREFPI